ncbi:MAG: 50S ribosomal protein L23 [Verrucomicrobiae bacterium]|nr:50S ribosomal protein L23 [Verrucomicrobiae bacterium]
MRDPFDIIKKIRITEKGTVLSDKHNQYLFHVDSRATKQEIKKAVETLFDKKVSRVNTLNILGKKKRERRADFGKRPDWKKAVVTLKEGEKISLV